MENDMCRSQARLDPIVVFREKLSAGLSEMVYGIVGSRPKTIRQSGTIAKYFSESRKIRAMPQKKSPVKLDAFNRKIIETLHQDFDITNQKLADMIGLSPAACSQRVAALKEAGYFFNFHCEVDLDRTFEHVLAYVEFTLSNNTAQYRRAFEKEIEKHPEFMDCLRLTGDVDYVSFTCARNIQELNKICDKISMNPDLKVTRIVTRVILERSKWYLGYPLAKLRWLE